MRSISNSGILLDKSMATNSFVNLTNSSTDWECIYIYIYLNCIRVKNFNFNLFIFKF
jgi:hypothetical protein